MSSFLAAKLVGKAFGEKRSGHTGTLDPMATGVLPVLIGRATALSSYMLDADKRYIAKVKLGIITFPVYFCLDILLTKTFLQ